jgi:iron complex outermembrane receptor protein
LLTAVRAALVACAAAVTLLPSLPASAGILLAIDPTLTEGLTSPGLQGSYTLEQAVTQLLAGSGLSYQFTNANTVTLEPLFSFDDGSFELPAISVEGRRFTDRAVGRKQSFNALGEREVLNTPFSVTSYTEELIEATNATTLRDVLTRDASVSSEDQQGGDSRRVHDPRI